MMVNHHIQVTHDRVSVVKQKSHQIVAKHLAPTQCWQDAIVLLMFEHPLRFWIASTFFFHSDESNTPVVYDVKMKYKWEDAGKGTGKYGGLRRETIAFRDKHWAHVLVWQVVNRAFRDSLRRLMAQILEWENKGWNHLFWIGSMKTWLSFTACLEQPWEWPYQVRSLMDSHNKAYWIHRCIMRRSVDFRMYQLHPMFSDPNWALKASAGSLSIRSDDGTVLCSEQKSVDQEVIRAWHHHRIGV